jgi:hypothetical protein
MESSTRIAAFESGVAGWQPEAGHHYTVVELAEAWNVSDDFTRDRSPTRRTSSAGCGTDAASVATSCSGFRAKSPSTH